MARISKQRKKRWFPIMAPKLFNQQVLGKSYVYEGSTLLGRILTVNMMTLTRNIRKQNIKVKFKIEELKGSNLTTSMMSYELIPSAVKRLVRRSKNKIEESFVVKTGDNVKIRIKPLIITRNKIKSSIVIALRKKLVEELTKRIGKLNFEALIKDMISNKLQKDVKYSLNKVYPVKISEIRVLKVLEVGEKPKVKEEPQKLPEETESPKQEKTEQTLVKEQPKP